MHHDDMRTVDTLNLIKLKLDQNFAFDRSLLEMVIICKNLCIVIRACSEINGAILFVKRSSLVVCQYCLYKWIACFSGKT